MFMRYAMSMEEKQQIVRTNPISESVSCLQTPLTSDLKSCWKEILHGHGRRNKSETTFRFPQVHKACSQACKGCGIAVVRLGPEPLEATLLEKRIALPALCVSCALGHSHIKSNTQPKKSYTLAQPSAVDKPGKASVAQREALKRKSEETNAGNGGKGFKDRFIGDLTGGLYPGDSGIFRMPDDTLAFKRNDNGQIIIKPVCGHWFTEADGTHSIYEWGKVVQRDEN